MPLFESKEFNEFISTGEQAFEFIFNLLSEFLYFIRHHPILYVPIFLITLLGITFLVGWIILEVSNSSYSTSWYYNPNKFYSTNIPAVIDLKHLHDRKIKARHKNQSYSKNNDYRVHNLNKELSSRYVPYTSTSRESFEKRMNALSVPWIERPSGKYGKTHMVPIHGNYEIVHIPTGRTKPKVNIDIEPDEDDFE